MEQNNTPLISVIVPVYNTEKYLDQCIQSVLAQTYTNWELLLIDDGSTDSSGAICDKYAAQDSRIRVFHKENGGVSSARNLGLDNAKGEWITFVDSDDWVNANLYTRLLHDSSGLLIVGAYKKASQMYILPNEKILLDKGENVLNLFMLPHFSVPWGKLYKRSILQKYNIRFDIFLSTHEDTLFVYQYMTYCDSIRMNSYVGYNYRVVSDGLSSKLLELNEIMYGIAAFDKVLQKAKKMWNIDISGLRAKVICTYLMKYKNAHTWGAERANINHLARSGYMAILAQENRVIPKGKKRHLIDWLFDRKYINLITVYVRLLKHIY